MGQKGQPIDTLTPTQRARAWSDLTFPLNTAVLSDKVVEQLRDD